MSNPPTIRRVSYAEILEAPNAQELLNEYEAECSLPQIGKTDPQADMYAALEKAGVMSCFGVFQRDNHPQEDATLVGFAAVLSTTAPHYGRRVATVESLFIASKHRRGRIGQNLLARIEEHAADAGCEAILYSAPVHSSLDQLLDLMNSYTRTNHVYCRSLV